MPERKVKGGIGMMLLASFGFALLKLQSRASPTGWLGGELIWVWVAGFVIGGGALRNSYE